jgi:hypothetical protein
MKTAMEYLELATRFRRAKLSATDNFARHQLGMMERSYLVLAESTALLERTKKTQEALEKRYYD